MHTLLLVWDENWLLLAVPAGAAIVGHTLGRLLRGRYGRT